MHFERSQLSSQVRLARRGGCRLVPLRIDWNPFDEAVAGCIVHEQQLAGFPDDQEQQGMQDRDDENRRTSHAPRMRAGLWWHGLDRDGIPKRAALFCLV